ncbi:GGDEF domain-containing protein [Shewanella woodyi]|uniref:Diguanylate cyclase n=1 Tax=Shewanella woodyi (strain ATCC 51908 / MS32) TaxID=392500 RepID=B1KQ82_SHEWM|nr:GGDEF domain-containing protein [Shewanella woodyi]ACA84737.1 diguanylate cyclase [Shewanella woodyi ATCC 51908]
MSNIAIALVTTGLLGLISAVMPTHQICNIPDHQHKGWVLLLTMIFMFIFGYLGYIWMLIDRDIGTLELIVATIFCGGGGFVFVISRMSKETIFKLQQTIHEKHYQAHHDLLTNLANRHQFYEELDSLISNEHHVFSCLMMDLNDFKMVNDTLGHAEGDHVLQVVAKRIQRILPKRGVAARLGGDEFAVVLPGMTLQGAIEISKTIQDTLSKDIQCENHALVIGISIGIAEYPKHGTNKKEIMKHADIAMYKAKATDGNYRVYSSHLD